eukprot:scaffold8911_cov43-Phaeocystis_antarctica.AAC.2
MADLPAAEKLECGEPTHNQTPYGERKVLSVFFVLLKLRPIYRPLGTIRCSKRARGRPSVLRYSKVHARKG